MRQDKRYRGCTAEIDDCIDDRKMATPRPRRNLSIDVHDSIAEDSFVADGARFPLEIVVPVEETQARPFAVWEMQAMCS